jgi:hypothetical protein
MRGQLYVGLFAAILAADGTYGAMALAADAPGSAAVTITVNNRNGGPILAQVMLRIGQLQKDPRFSPFLTRPPLDQPQSACIADARKDASGHVFDVARCVGVWPEANKAPALNSFEAAFARPVQQKGIAALPWVKVTPYAYSQIVGQHEFDSFSGTRLVKQEGTLTPTDNFLKVLCDPRQTLMPYGDCKARVKVMDRLVYEPDIFVGQTGYKVEVLGKMPKAAGLAFHHALLEGIHLNPGTRRDALRVTITDDAPVRMQGLQTSETPAAATALNPIEQLWETVHARPSAVDLTPNSDDTAPALLLFDSIDVAAAGPFGNWVQSLNAGTKRFSDHQCPSGEAATAHTDAVASLLMPAGVSLLFPPSGAARPLSVPTFPGFIFTPGQFAGGSVLDNYSWFERQGLQLNDDVPVVALVVYDAGVTAGNSAAAKNALDSFLVNKSNIVVVSAANWPGAGSPPRFPPGSPTNDPSAATFSCRTMPWPSCLGVHPQVLVVGPTGAPADRNRFVVAPSKYVLGGAVRIAAPSTSIPVLIRCAGADADWSSRTHDGTSFGAPLVALLLAKIIQVGPPAVRDLPEAAIWRLEATANPLSLGDDDNFTGFGEIDAGRALRGASAAEAGEWSSAALYEAAQDPMNPSLAVVMPYPWNDVPKNIETRVGTAGALGVDARSRSAITITSFDTTGAHPQMLSLDFKNILRIARRTDTTPNQGQLFDIYYINPDDPKLRYVQVLRRARFGPANLDIANPGYCRSDDLPQPSQAAGSDIEPSCLYVWRTARPGFEPLDLGRVQDIVFPSSHVRARFIKGVSLTDFASLARADSPWSTEFCRVGLRRAVAKALGRRWKAADLATLCPASGAGAGQ